MILASLILTFGIESGQELVHAASQTNRELEQRLIAIRDGQKDAELQRELAVAEVKAQMGAMQNGIESKLLPPLETIARNMTEYNKTMVALNIALPKLIDAAERKAQTDVVGQIAQIAGNATMVLAGIVIGANRALKMWRESRKEES